MSGEIRRAMKRLMDVSGASAGLVVLAPLIAAAALLVAITMGRPVLYGQLRPGLGGRPFTVYKIRTTRPSESGDELFSLTGRERLTPAGRFLRRTSIDELPVLWNVLKGDMSLVGPSPLSMESLSRYPPGRTRRHNIRPGVTGLAQVNGRQEISRREPLELDLWYVDNWTLKLDAKILLKTLGRVVGSSEVAVGQVDGRAEEAPTPRAPGQIPAGEGPEKGSGRRLALAPMKVRLLRASSGSWTSFLHEVPHDFYHLPAYTKLAASQEGGDPVALLVEDGAARMLLPLIVRPIVHGGHDATSPYGYPGPLVSGSDDPTFLPRALIEGKRLLGSEGIVSLFVRLHPLLNRVLPEGVGVIENHGDTVSVDLTLPSDVHWSQTSHGHRNQINRSLKAGHIATFDTDWKHFDTFKRLYRDTMIRVSASRRYFFDDAYFDELRRALGERLRLATVEVDGAIAAAALFVETDGIVQYHLSATDERYARHRPTKVMLHFVRTWAKERGNDWLHLGGGRGATNDSLLQFKAGFSPSLFPFHTLRMVIMGDEYARLVVAGDPGRDPKALTGFFPAYRRTIS